MNHFQQYGCFPVSVYVGHSWSFRPLVSSISLGFQSFHYNKCLSSPWLGLFLDSVDVITNAIVFPISFSVSSFLVLRESTDFQVLIFVFDCSPKFVNQIYNLTVESFRDFGFFFSSVSSDFFGVLLVFQSIFFSLSVFVKYL